MLEFILSLISIMLLIFASNYLKKTKQITNVVKPTSYIYRLYVDNYTYTKDELGILAISRVPDTTDTFQLLMEDCTSIVYAPTGYTIEMRNYPVYSKTTSPTPNVVLGNNSLN